MSEQTHIPGQWPAGCARPSSRPRLSPARRPIPARPVATTVPTVQAEVTLDLSSARVTSRADLGAAVADQLRRGITGMSLRVIVGDVALGDLSLPRLLAGRALGAVSITVVGGRDALGHEVRWFTDQLTRECASVLADHLQMIAEVSS